MIEVNFLAESKFHHHIQTTLLSKFNWAGGCPPPFPPSTLRMRGVTPQLSYWIDRNDVVLWYWAFMFTLEQA